MRFCNQIGIAHSDFLDWSAVDRSKALASMIFEAQFCELCGTAPWEWDKDQGGSRFAYVPKMEICPGCERKDWLREDNKERVPGSFIILVKPEQ